MFAYHLFLLCCANRVASQAYHTLARSILELYIQAFYPHMDSSEFLSARFLHHPGILRFTPRVHAIFCLHAAHGLCCLAFSSDAAEDSTYIPTTNIPWASPPLTTAVLLPVMSRLIRGPWMPDATQRAGRGVIFPHMPGPYRRTPLVYLRHSNSVHTYMVQRIVSDVSVYYYSPR